MRGNRPGQPLHRGSRVEWRSGIRSAIGAAFVAIAQAADAADAAEAGLVAAAG